MNKIAANRVVPAPAAPAHLPAPTASANASG